MIRHATNRKTNNKRHKFNHSKLSLSPADAASGAIHAI